MSRILAITFKLSVVIAHAQGGSRSAQPEREHSACSGRPELAMDTHLRR